MEWLDLLFVRIQRRMSQHIIKVLHKFDAICMVAMTCLRLILQVDGQRNHVGVCMALSEAVATRPARVSPAPTD